MQIEKALINDDLRVSIVSWKFRISTIHHFVVIYLQNLLFSSSNLLFNSFYFLFFFINKTLRLNNLKTRSAMNTNISVFVICAEVIIYLILCNSHDSTFSYFYHCSVREVRFMKLLISYEKGQNVQWFSKFWIANCSLGSNQLVLL